MLYIITFKIYYEVLNEQRKTTWNHDLKGLWDVLSNICMRREFPSYSFICSPHFFILLNSIVQWHLVFPTMCLMFSLLSSSLVMMTKWVTVFIFLKGPFRVSIYRRECQNLYSASPTNHVLCVFSIHSLLIEYFHMCLNKHKHPLIS